MASTVAALYVDPHGPYWDIPGVDCWDIKRNAKLYCGPHPVVCHPPCGPWGRLRHLCKYQDRECAIAAVEALRQWGGVLEHPAQSKLWDELCLPKPGELSFDGLKTQAISQVEWGHACRKKTWILLSAHAPRLPPPPYPGRKPTHWVTSWGGEAAREGFKAASSKLKRLTPPLLAQELVRVARASLPPTAAPLPLRTL